ncbi:MAG: adenylate/guanylate cyclase domain-containing protein [Leptolyngbyaceae cyanobacterium MO_188.B28]|nr:adenylate/guanylate cyclase domain-containing protein [Leptolyngbyaceae cyanobacterium MO_188.B28]
MTASIGSILTINLISLLRSKAIIRRIISNELTYVRASKAHEIQLYFNEIHAHIQTLCEDPTIVNAMVEFDTAFQTLNQVSIPSDWDRATEKYYQIEFFSRLSQHISGTPHFDVYRPLSQAARYLQYRYIVDNFYAVGEKDKLLDAGDDSDYNQLHIKYHSFFSKLTHQFHYDNLYLINFDTGEVVYSVDKTTDLGANLEDGPYQYSNLGDLVKAVHRNPHREAVHMVDFNFYHPSFGEPEAFMGGPIYSGQRIVGILAVEMPVTEIDNILSNNQNWLHDGLGKTGEVYLVGSDQLMRSTSRFFIETPEDYKARLRANRTPLKTIESIEKHGSSILLQKVDTEAVREALIGEEGTKIINGYQGRKVLSAYGPLSIEGLDWAVVAEMERDEAYQPLQALELYIFMGTVIIILLVTWFANFGANLFLRPLKLMIAEIHQADVRQQDFKLQINSHDELDELAQAINSMAYKLSQQTRQIQQEAKENEALLLNILPSRVAQRFDKGEEQIAETIEQATVLVSTIRGFTELSARTSVSEAAGILNELINFFEQAARKQDVERFQILGDRYLAVCGVNRLYLDHTKRVVDFALEISSILEGFNQKYHTSLRLHIGIHKGPLMAAIIRTKESQKFTYNLWGKTMDIANKLNQQAQPNTILVSQSVYDALRDLYSFDQDKTLDIDAQEKLVTWLLRDPSQSGAKTVKQNIQNGST